MEDPRPPSVVDRYFQKRYKTDVRGNPCEDQLILTHSNRICVVCIAPTHPIICGKKSISKIKFEGEGWNRLENTVSGKNKRGAQWLERMAPLCCVTCTDGSVYTLCCCVKGQLVEINLNLESRPNLLTEKPSSNGYIAVILPGLKHFDREVERLKSEEQYRHILSLRSKETAPQNQQPHPALVGVSNALAGATSEQIANSVDERDMNQEKDAVKTIVESDEGSTDHHINNAVSENLL